jgi:hypothetical protein
MVNDVNMLLFSPWRGEFSELWRAWAHTQLNFDIVTLLASLGVFVFILCYFKFILPRRPPLYLVDFACFKAPDELKLTQETFVSRALKSGYYCTWWTLLVSRLPMS